LQKLEQKLHEAKSRLVASAPSPQRGPGQGRAQTTIGDNSKSVTFDRLKDRVHHSESVATAEVELVADDADERLTRRDRDIEVERLLTDLKTRRRLPG